MLIDTGAGKSRWPVCVCMLCVYIVCVHHVVCVCVCVRACRCLWCV